MGRRFSDLVALPGSPSAWLLAGTLLFASMPAIRIADAVPVCFVLFAAAVLAGTLERLIHREYRTGTAMRRVFAMYLLAGALLSLSYIVNAMGTLTQTASPLSIRGQGFVPVLPNNFMDFIWGRLGPQEPHFLGLLAATVLMPLAMLAIRLKSWAEFRFVLLAWTFGAVCGAVFVLAYCNGLIPGRVEFTWVYLGRAHGLTQHPNILGINSMLAIMPVVMLWFESRNRLVRGILIGSALLLWLAIDYSGSRSATGGALLLIAAAIFARAPDWPSRQRAVAAIGVLSLAGIALLYGVLPWLQLQPASLQRLMTGSYGSDLARDIISGVIHEELWRNPVFGAGYHLLMVAHNIYVQLLHAAGLVGLLGFGLTLAIPVAVLYSAPASLPGHPVRAALAGAVVTLIGIYWVQSNPSHFGSTLMFALAVYAGMAHRTTDAFDPLCDASPVEPYARATMPDSRA